nr:unnamed protein product [Spirometra erinaceieuropaei]
MGIPLPPIVSLIGAPNYKISKWLFYHSQPRKKNSENFIEELDEFLDKSTGVSVASDEITVSFNVVSIFTSIPLDLARRCTEELLQAYTIDVPADALLQLLDTCLETNFPFAKQCYRQLKCASMGSLISGFLADAIMQKLESVSLPKINPKFWLRYVDDTVVIAKKNQLDLLHTNLNSRFPRIKFTFETETDGKLLFLDVLLPRKLMDPFTLHIRGHPTFERQTGRMLESRIREHKLAVRRGDALSQAAAHTYEMSHEFDFAATKIVAHAGNKTGRELIEAWASDENSVNRFIDLAPAYRALRSRLQSCDVGR